VLALSDTHLVGASVPLRYDAGDAPLVSSVPGIAQLASGLTRGFRYTVWSDAPQPTAAELAQSKAIYPESLIEPGTFLDVGRGITMPPFGMEDLPARARALRAARATAIALPGARAVRGRGKLMSFFARRRLRVHEPPASPRGNRAACRLRDPDEGRLLPVLRGCHGAHAPISRRAGARRGRVLEWNV
jgi:hypothetical protein